MKHLLKNCLLAATISTGHSIYAYGSGTAFQVGLGVPAVEITNPDNSIAGYNGFTFQSRLFIETLGLGNFNFNFHGTLKYQSLTNRNSKFGKETATQEGLGGGLSIWFHKLYVGYEYQFLKAEHQFTGNNLGAFTELNYTNENVFIGVVYPVGKKINFGINYELGNAKIPKSETKLSRDSKYQEQTILLTLTFDWDGDLWSAVGDLTK